MTHRFPVSLLVLTALSALGSSVAAPADFVGTWTNLDTAHAGITRVVISPVNASVLKVQVFGKCSPSDCDWGSANLLTYGANVADANHFTASAVYSKGFASTTLVLGLRGRVLSVQSLTQFTDSSGRQNYSALETFRR